jgi:hypothetical protein
VLCFQEAEGPKTAPWLQAVVHRPFFDSAQHPSGTAVEILSVLEAGPKKLVRKAG